MEKRAAILVTGAGGMVGAAVARRLRTLGFSNVLTPLRGELDLTVEDQVDRYFSRHRPDHALMIAAKVGGIAANMAEPVRFVTENLRIQLNLFEACRKYGTKKNLFLGSSCIYPRECPQPMREEHLLSGPLEPTNKGYALAKIVGIQMAKAYRVEHGVLTICPMPCNIYGTGDHFDFQRAHVLSSLVRRFVDSHQSGADTVTLWGTGSAQREFIHVDDVVEAILLLLDAYDGEEIINVGTGFDVSIQQLAEMIGRAVGFRGSVEWDSSKPDGTPRKCLDISRIAKLGFQARVSLDEGVRRTVNEYVELKRARGSVA